MDFASPTGQVDNVTDPDSGALLGIAVTAADTNNGSWLYSTNNGTSWNALGAVATNNARLLAADANTRLYFQPTANWNGTLTTAITFRAWDQTSSTNGSLADTTTNGGTTAFSTTTDTASLVINAVNDAPASTDKTVTTSQGAAYTFAAGDFGFSDPVDTPANNLLAVKITTLPWVGSLTNNGTAVTAGQTISLADIAGGKLRFMPAAGINGASVASFTFQVQDDGGTANGGVDLDPTPNTITIDVAGIRIATASQLPPVGAEMRVNTTTADVQRTYNTVPHAVARDAAGNAIVVWSSYGQDGSSDGVYAQRYDAQGNALGGEFRVNTTTAQSQTYPAVAMAPAGEFVVTWSDSAADSGGYGVYAQRYNSAGVAQGGEFRVNSYTSDNQYYSSAAMDAAGNFVVVWESFNQDGSGSGIYAQRYNAAGVAQGSEFRVNTTTNGNQTAASIAMDAAGNFVVTWVDNTQDGSNGGVYAQRYNASGVAQGGEFRVNTTTHGRSEVLVGEHERRRRLCGHVVERRPGWQRLRCLCPAVQRGRRGPRGRNSDQHKHLGLPGIQRCGDGRRGRLRHYLVVRASGRERLNGRRPAVCGRRHALERRVPGQHHDHGQSNRRLGGDGRPGAVRGRLARQRRGRHQRRVPPPL